MATDERTLQSIADEVFELLKRKGPMIPAQICVELLLSREIVRDALAVLEEAGVVEQRPDRDSLLNQGGLVAWGLPTLRWRNKQRRAS